MKRILTLVLTIAAMNVMGQNSLMIESQSNKQFKETIEWLEGAANEQNWKVIAIHNMQDALDKNGFQVLPIKVFSICLPEIANKVLSQDEDRIISAMMPCRISVYEKSDRNTYISRINTDLMVSNFEGNMKEVMESTGSKIEELLKPVVQSK